MESIEIGIYQGKENNFEFFDSVDINSIKTKNILYIYNTIFISLANYADFVDLPSVDSIIQ